MYIVYNVVSYVALIYTVYNLTPHNACDARVARVHPSCILWECGLVKFMCTLYGTWNTCGLIELPSCCWTVPFKCNVSLILYVPYLSVGFPTTPMDSTGVAHILEHTVLCGSKKYPVRDPFFKMMNRSVQTFMNAFTGMWFIVVD